MAATFAAECDQHEQAEFIPFLHELIGTALQVIGPLFLSGATVSTKGDASPVTAADRGAEEAMRRLIEQRYPQHGIIGEEFGVKESPSSPGDGPRYRWVLDPVDGTRAFITNCFLFGTLIALERADESVPVVGNSAHPATAAITADTAQPSQFAPILGVIAHPAAGVALIGHRRRTTLYARAGTQRDVRVRACAQIEAATVLSTSHWSTGEQSDAVNTARIGGLTARASLYRTWGDCFGYFALATGGADVMLDPQLAYWDVAAIVPVIEGAGGRVTNWLGGDPLREPSLIATAGPLHDTVLRLLHGT
jgi:fructose-1,6-bisphosphatase/inositol monophosphatase family enzyme